MTNSLKLCLLTLTLTLFACKKNEPPAPGIVPVYNTRPTNAYNPPAITFNATVSGFAVDEQGNAIKEAKITTGNKTTTTDDNGAFTLSNAPFTGDFCYIRAEKAGYFTGSSTITGKSGNKFQVTLTLIQQTNTQTYHSAQTAEIKLLNNAAVEFPANAVQTATGMPYTGEVKVSIAHLNPEAPNFRELIPGGDLRAFDANKQDVILYSYGMLNVELHDNEGNLLQLEKGQKATLKFPVPANMLSTAPSTIPLWYFDDVKGVWIEDGEATLNGNMYTGEVSHFTPWNVDVSTPPANLTGKVADIFGDPVPYATVYLNQVYTQTAADGTFTTPVPSGMQIDVDIYNPYKKAKEELNTTVKALSGNEKYDMGVVTLQEMAKLTATINSCDGAPFYGYAILRSQTAVVKTFISSGLNITVPTTGEAIDIEFYNSSFTHQHKQHIILPTTTATKNLDTITVCGPVSYKTFISFTYDDGSGPIDVDYQLHPYMTAMYQYSNNSKLVKIVISDAEPYATNSDFHFEFVADKKGTGAFTLLQYVNTPRAVWEMDDRGVKEKFLSTNMKMNITEYGAFGEPVKGTFSGTAIRNTLNITITNGKFTVVHYPDKP